MPLTLSDSEITFQVSSKVTGLSLFGKFASDVTLTLVNSAVSYQLQNNTGKLIGLADKIPKLTVNNSNITISTDKNAQVSTVTGLAVQSGALELENSNITFQIAGFVDRFVGLTSEQLDKATITKTRLSGKIAANEFAFGLF